MEISQEELHQYYDPIEGGVCLVRVAAPHTIVFASSGLLELYRCSSEEEFYSLTNGQLEHMIYHPDYESVLRSYREGRRFITFRRIGLDSSVETLLGFISETKIKGESYYYLHLMSQKIEARYHQSGTLQNICDTNDFFDLVLKRVTTQPGNYVPVVFNVTNFKEYNRFYGISAGDDCITKIAETLEEVFGDDVIGHTYADNFMVCAKNDRLITKIEEVCETINHYIGNSSILLKCGLFVCSKHPTLKTIRHSFDRAKLACTSISHDATKNYAYYTDEMSDMQDHKLYIIRNFDTALEKGYIKVYVQPVVRTYSEKLCGLEALARWDDPELGLISPGLFVPILEDARLISKLDRYIIEKVCQHFAVSLKSNKSIVPVSVNLSRLDFDLLDPFEYIEEVIEKYQVPRKLLRIEITETVLQRNEAKLATMISKFHNAGYQVWLDDFGSEYSSLNALHNYHFDELKIDMGFFRNFDEKSRKIITSVVMMAKVLGMHTLAEGVETKEQADFLRSIGCGKIQGYYYGKPMPYEDCLKHCLARQITPETETDAHMYDAAELINIISTSPIGIFHFDGEVPEMLAWNDAYLKVMAQTGTFSREDGNINLAAKDYPLRGKFAQALHNVYTHHHDEVITYVDNGQYMRISVSMIAGEEDDWLGICHLSNVSNDYDYNDTEKYDLILRHLYLMYDGVYYLNRRENQIEVVECIHEKVGVGTIFKDIDASFQEYASELIAPADRDRFLAFIKIDHLHQALAKTDRAEISDIFRVKREDGQYHWTIFFAILLFKSQSKDIVICERQDFWESHKDDQTFKEAFKNLSETMNKAENE